MVVYWQYYYGNGPLSNHNVSKIITQVVKGLLADPRRRFSYVEQVRVLLVQEPSEAPVDGPDPPPAPAPRRHTSRSGTRRSPQPCRRRCRGWSPLASSCF